MERFKQGLFNLKDAIPKNKEHADVVKSDFTGHLQKYSFLATVEEKTGRTRFEIVSGIIGGFLTMLLAGIFIKWLGILMTRLFGFIYPCYMSMKAIESDAKGDDTQWLTYWMIFAIFSLMEETILKPVEDYAPFYFVWKIVFLLWCYLPQTHGADLIYSEFVGPKLRELEAKLLANKED